MTNVRRRVALVAGTMLLAGAASSGVAMASTPPVVHPSVQTNYCDDDWGNWGDDCDHGGYYGGHGDHAAYVGHGNGDDDDDYGDYGGY
ncbi:hypothetical protein ACWEWI_08600 [Streptomyces sp. NPDC003753]|uniref:hypothetical protein n=1 Tax=unclassified Streptomyces TaxID=2593676 RepID=UPI001905579E|nr:hypothetical protein [Streptomyces sp. Y2F8-2]GHK01373.1 hypothetical protein SY2F82_31700 [Streptomyces sp. Y2F8-2]